MTDSDIECFCYIAYLGPFWFIGILSDKRNHPKLRFHLNQGLVLFIAEMIVFLAVFFVGGLIGRIPYVGGILEWILWLAAVGCAFWLAVSGMLTVAADIKKRLPWIGKIDLLR